MTLLRVYNRNGHDVAGARHDYAFPDLMKDFFDEPSGYTLPKVNVSEDKDMFTLLMALPGLDKSEINLSVERDVLTISRKSGESESKDPVNFSRREFDFGSFERKFRLPDTVATEKISAVMENGVLKVIFPKKDEAIEKGPVEIKIS